MYCYGVTFIRIGMISPVTVYFELLDDALEFFLYMDRADTPVRVFLSDYDRIRFFLAGRFYISGQDFRRDW